mmetsp:Transcript_11373/g.28752  ORF Transcript_11373/g.28752 Transcript_11373/m.28752 type:complete len:214 (-) Transcript_11373:281-922(-)
MRSISARLPSQAARRSAQNLPHSADLSSNTMSVNPAASSSATYSSRDGSCAPSQYTSTRSCSSSSGEKCSPARKKSSTKILAPGLSSLAERCQTWARCSRFMCRIQSHDTRPSIAPEPGRPRSLPADVSSRKSAQRSSQRSAGSPTARESLLPTTTWSSWSSTPITRSPSASHAIARAGCPRPAPTSTTTFPSPFGPARLSAKIASLTLSCWP